VSRLRFAVILTCLAVVLGLGAGLSSASADETEPAPDPMAGAPEVGRCYQATLRQAVGESLALDTVSCKKKHTMWVVATKQVSASLLEAADPKELRAVVGRTCASAVTKALGKPKWEALSGYRQFWFVPTAGQRAEGARWISCTVGLLQGKKLAASKKRKPVRVGAGMPDSVRACATAKWMTTCNAAHRFRAVHAAPVRRIPNAEAKAQRLAARTCAGKVRTPRFSWNGRITGKANTIFLVCYAVTRR